jgi:hypothetical protein
MDEYFPSLLVNIPQLEVMSLNFFHINDGRGINIRKNKLEVEGFRRQNPYF